MYLAIKLSGLVSGMDTEAIIEQMMEAQSYKKTKLVNKQTKLNWQQDKWKELNTKIYKLYTDQVSKMRLSSSFSTKAVTSSNEGKVIATSENTAATGSHTIEVKELASSQYITGSKVSTTSGSKATTSTKLTDLGFSTSGTNSVITIDGPDSGDNKNVVELTVTDTTTVKDFVDACKSAGLNASFDAGQQRFFISSKESGAEHSFTITTGQVAGTAVTSLEEMKKAMNYSTLSAEDKTIVEEALNKFKVDGGYDLSQVTQGNFDSLPVELQDAYRILTIQVNQATDVNLQAKAKEHATTSLGTEEEYIKADLLGKVKGDNPDVSDEEELKKLVDEAYSKLTEEEKTKYSSDYKTLYDEKYEEIYTEAKLATAQQDAITSLKSNLQIYSKDSGITSTDGSVLKGLGLDEASRTEVKASDAVFILDGATLTSDSNSISVNGLNLTFKGVTAGQETLNVVNNNQAVYDMVKEFVNQYNTILEEMNNLYYASSAKGYEPLTDEEKESMSESQIEMWEGKIKDSLLRRDSTLGSLTNAMKSAMMSSVEVNGVSYSLSTFGITTSTDYTEKGLLHIQGNSDDSTYSDLEDKLMAAIQNDPETVTKALTGIASNLYTTMTDKMKASSLSSAMTFYNDKQMTKLDTQYKSDITKLERRLQQIEERYYKQFSAMETALSTINSQSSYLSGLFS